MPFVTSINKRGLFFTASTSEAAIFSAQPGIDIYTQADLAVEQLIENCESHGLNAENLLKLVVYYVDDGLTFKNDLLEFISGKLDFKVLPVISLIPLSRHHSNQLKVMIEAVGMSCIKTKTALGFATNGHSRAIRCGEMIFIGAIDATDDRGNIQYPGDIIEQSHIVLAKLDFILQHFGAHRKDIVKINNWYVAGGSAEQWSQGAKIRAAYYPEPGPVATGLPLKTLGIGGLVIQTDCWVMIDELGNSIEKQFSWPHNHWDWPIHLPFKHGLKCRDLIFTGGQVSMDRRANVLDHNDMPRQTHASMRNIVAVLKEFDVDLADVVKLSAFYQSREEPVDLLENQAIRAGYFSHRGPQSTAIPLDYLAYEGMLTEFEVIAFDARAD